MQESPEITRLRSRLIMAMVTRATIWKVAADKLSIFDGIRMVAKAAIGNATREECEANAAKIVRAVNAHDAMYAALKDLLGDMLFIQDGECTRCGRDYRGDVPDNDQCDEDCPGMIARAALALAEGTVGQ